MAQNKLYWEIMKRIVAALSSAKAKTLALKSKTNALKTRFVIFLLLNNKKFAMSSISHKFQTLLRHHHHLREYDQESKTYHDNEDVSKDLQSTKALVNDGAQRTPSNDHQKYFLNFWKQEFDGDEDREKYPELTHSMFEMEDEEDYEGGTSSLSVIEMVKHSKEEKGEKFDLEDEIDRVADLFIKKFHRHILFQKQRSLKGHQDMLQHST